MTSFPASARRVRDPSLPPQRRLHALRECVLRFAPYGFRATWHHLVVSTPIPPRLEDDVDSLVRALDEVESARALLLPVIEAYHARRRAEKAAGRRAPAEPVPFQAWGWCATAFCPDPEHHPREPLPVVVRRVLSPEATELRRAGSCVVCRTPDVRGRTCPTCGVDARGRAAARYARRDPDRWSLIWRRLVDAGPGTDRLRGGRR